jgi:two-component system cell cycle response regulator DivK
MSGEPILIVDDNPSNMKLVSFLLTNRGYEVKTAASAAAAVEVLRTFVPRLILMDLQMPVVDGFEFTRRLKADPKTREIVIIAVTAYAMKGDEKNALAAGCDGYVTKPIDTRTLPVLIAAHLSKQKPEAP